METTGLEVKTVTIYACNDGEYDEKLNELCRDGWEPFASEYEQDDRYKVRLKRIPPPDHFDSSDV